MDERFLLLAVLLPLLGGGLLPLTHRKGPKVMYGAAYAITAATSLQIGRASCRERVSSPV